MSAPIDEPAIDAPGAAPESAPIMLPLAEITVDLRIHPRVSGLDPDHICLLAEVLDQLPPIIVARCENHLLLCDGFHTVAAAERLGRTHIRAQIVECPDRSSIMDLAFARNVLHGLALSLPDRRRYAVRLLKRNPKWSSRRIGKACGLSHHTIEKLRAELEACGQIAHMETREGDRAGGYDYRPPEKEPSPPDEPPARARPGSTEGTDRGPDDAARQAETEPVSAERAAQRRLVRYLEQAAELLPAQFKLPDWSPAAFTAAVVATCDEAAIDQLVINLEPGALNLLQVARGLGYDPDAGGGSAAAEGPA